MMIKRTLVAFMTVSLFMLGACSKDKESPKPTGQTTSPNVDNPSEPDTKNFNNVIQKLASNYKGSSGSYIVASEENDVSFGMQFTTSKTGKITKVRAYTGENKTYYIYLWTYNKETFNWTQLSQQVITTSTTDFSGDAEPASTWTISPNTEYIISIKIYGPTAGTKLVRLSSNSTIATGEGLAGVNSTIGPLTFDKNFLWVRNTSGYSNRPYQEGSYLHFAGLLDFDFEVTE